MEFIKKNKNGIIYYSLDALDEAGFENMFTTKYNGVSFENHELNFGTSCGDTKENTLENFRLALSCVSSSPQKAVKSKQTHSDVVLNVDNSFSGEGILKPQRFFEADGLITREKDLSLIVFYADCVPVIIAEKKNRTVCAVHSGWRGTQANIISKAIDKMEKTNGCNCEDMIVAVGPCIGMCHFEVDKNLYDIFIPKYGNEYGKSENEKYYINLGKIVARQAELAGVKKENIAFMDKCTYCNEEFYSFRRQKEAAGRMAAVIHC